MGGGAGQVTRSSQGPGGRSARALLFDQAEPAIGPYCELNFAVTSLYEGYVVENPDDPESILAPLDNFGTPNAGCTRLETWQSGKGGGWKAV